MPNYLGSKSVRHVLKHGSRKLNTIRTIGTGNLFYENIELRPVYNAYSARVSGSSIGFVSAW